MIAVLLKRGPAQWRDAWGEVWEGTQSFCSVPHVPQRASPSRHICVFTRQEALLSFMGQIFYWGFITEARLTESWATWLKSALSPLLPPWRSGSGKSRQPSHHRVGLPGAQPSAGSRKPSPSGELARERNRDTPVTQEMLRVVHAPCRKAGTKTRQVLYYTTVI